MTKKPTVGPAYPISVLGETLKGQEGMTLRDAIAISALEEDIALYLYDKDEMLS